jgi:ABC-type lipoprotein export system ATPase subunit
MVTHNPDLISYATRTYGMTRGKLVKNTSSYSCKEEARSPKIIGP